ncbi:MAG: hypothetical protein NTW19_24520 [Planctomycetota bacterium]|nr:hypothetical protein [Planctomycetota bacterium]
MKPSRKVASRGLRLLAALVLLGGCSRAVKSPVANPFEIDPREFDRVFTASVLELRAQGFAVDRQDYRFGRVTTKPLPSPTIIEPWRDTNTTVYQAETATLNSQRRLVTVRIDPASAATQPESDSLPVSAAAPAASNAPTTMPARAGTYQLGVEVHIEQLQIPTRRLAGSTRGPAMINEMPEVPTELAARGIKPIYWQAVGRDPYLEQRLLTAIIRRSVNVTPGEDRAPAGIPDSATQPSSSAAPKPARPATPPATQPVAAAR